MFVRKIFALTLVAVCAYSTLASTEEFDAEGDPVYEYAGPIFFGFVKDTSGASVSEAKVTLAAKVRDAGITYTNSVGAYRISHGKDVDANAILISCEKEGFKQVRVFRRTALNAHIQTPIETECTLMATE